MKRSLRRLFLPLVSFSLLTSCGGSSSPKSAKEKITYAFNGVERSMLEQKGNKKSAPLPRLAPSSQDIDTLFSLMTNNEQVENPNFDYDEPPMMQFQYIKALYNKVGNDFALGTTYYDAITGTIDFDFTTGERGLSQSYTMNLSLDIDIDENDLITAHCGMDVTYLDASNISHHQLFYADMELDYDMDNENPTYTLGMHYVDDCASFPDDEAIVTYEYDYVDTQNNVIKEWRKALVQSNIAMNLDAGHSDFASYLNEEGFKYSVESKGYKGSTFYRADKSGSYEPSKETANVALASLLVNKLGCNGKDIAYEAYFAKSKTEQSKIKELYQEFSRALGEDICQSIAYTGAGEFEKKEDDPIIDPPEPENEITDLEILWSETHARVDETLVVKRDCNINQLLSDNTIYQGNTTEVPELCLLDEDGNYVETLNVKADFDIYIYTSFDRLQANPEDYLSSFTYVLEKETVFRVEFDYTNMEKMPTNKAYAELFIDVSALLGGGSSSSSSSSSEETVYPEYIVMSGTFNNWSNTDSPIYLSNMGDGVYQTTVQLSKKDQFKFLIDMNWDLCFGYNDTSIDDETLFVEGSNGNIKLKNHALFTVTATVPAPNTYQFAITNSEVLAEDPRGGEHLVMSMYLCGDFNSWDINDHTRSFLNIAENVFQVQFQQDPGLQAFKIIVNDSWDLAYGYSDIPALANDHTFQTDQNDNIIMKTGQLNLVTITATGPTAVDLSFEITYEPAVN